VEQSDLSGETGSGLRSELAAVAARLIAEEGCEYAQAKRRALQEVLGSGANRRTTMPDNSEVEYELRRYLQLFGGEEQRRLLTTLRVAAAEIMQTLQEFNPHLVGAVLNGTATQHSDINLHLFVDSAKDVEHRLLNLGIDFDVQDGDRESDGSGSRSGGRSNGRHGNGPDRPAAFERISFVVRGSPDSAPRATPI